MTAEDVAATFNLHADPDSGSNALSAFTGVLSKGGAQATDATTVVFELEAPNGNFPFTTSSDNYNLIILPKGFDPTTWPKTFMGTGPWKLEKYTPNVGVTYTKNPDYWDKTRAAAARPQRDQVLREGGGRRSSASRATRSTCSPSSRRSTARRCSPTRTST